MKKLIDKILAIGIIFILISITFASSVNADIKEDFVEITVEFCGIDNTQPNTIKLTKQEAEEIENLFSEIQKKLENVETKKQTMEIFNEAIAELDRYGLLGNISFKEAQRLITGGHQRPIFTKTLENLFNKRNNFLDPGENLLCLIAGRTNNTIIAGFLAVLIDILLDIPFLFRNFLGLALMRLQDVIIRVSSINPFCLGRCIYYHEAFGWVITFGLRGFKYLDGNLSGSSIGFTGLQITYRGLSSYLGYAVYASIEET